MRPTNTAIASALATTLVFASASGFAQSVPPAGNAADSTFVTVQPQGLWLASQFLGQAITNQAGETIGDVNDVLFDKNGRVATVVIGVGGFLGLGEKNVAVPFDSLSFTADASGKRVVTVPLSKERLQAAPEFKANYMRAKETAVEMGQKAVDKARQLGDQAGKKIEDMRK
jgi:sporulation protein YlmC with PRC-barrel domain